MQKNWCDETNKMHRRDAFFVSLNDFRNLSISLSHTVSDDYYTLTIVDIFGRRLHASPFNKTGNTPIFIDHLPKSINKEVLLIRLESTKNQFTKKLLY